LIAHGPQVTAHSPDVAEGAISALPATSSVAAVTALDVEAAKKIAIAIIAGSVVLAVLTAKFVKAAVVKAIVILVLGSVIVITVSQRANIGKCAKDIEAQYVSGTTTETAHCKFLGMDFEVKTPGGNTFG
jgi:uncharacterized membrane protein YfcA